MITIDVDLKAVEQAMGVFADQLPFAASKAINDLLIQGQSDQLAQMNDVFTIRRQAFAKRSIKIEQFAKKENLQGIIGVVPVGSFDAFTKFEKGGTKTGSGNIAVPSRFIQPDRSRLITKTKKPRVLKNSFKGQTSSGTPSINVRIGKGKNEKIRAAFFLKPSVRIKPMLFFDETVRRSVDRHFDEFLNRRLNDAIASARLR